MDFSFSYKKTPQGSGQPPTKGGVGEGQYNQLRGCGITMRPPKGWWDVQRGHDPETYAARPFVRVLELMGAMNPDGEPWSDDVWFYKSPGTIDENEVTNIVTNVKRIMKDAFPLGDPVVSTDSDTNAIKVTIEVNCVEETWELDPSGDVVAQALDKLGTAAAANGEGRVATLDAEGGVLVTFMNETEVGELTNETRQEWKTRG